MTPKPPKAKEANPLPPTPTQNPSISAGESAKKKFPALDPSNAKAKERLTHLDRVAKARKLDAADRKVGKVQGNKVDSKGRPLKGHSGAAPAVADKPYVPSADDREEAQNSSQMYLGNDDLLEMKGANKLDPAKLKKAGKWEKAKGIAKGIGGAATAVGGAALAAGGVGARVLGKGVDVAGRAVSAAGLKKIGGTMSGVGKATGSLGKSAQSGGVKGAKFGTKLATGGVEQAKKGHKMKGTAEKLAARADRLKAQKEGEAADGESAGAEGAENSTPETTPAPSGKEKTKGKQSSLKLVK